MRAAVLAGTLVLLGVASVLAGVWDGGGSKKTATTASTPNTATNPKTAPAAKPARVRTKNGKPVRTPLSQTPATTLAFSGTGSKDIGKPEPLRIPVDSTLQWTDAGAPATRIFQIIPASPKAISPVNSREASGSAPIKKGAYYGFLVNTNLYDKWTLKIVPGG
ncbi:MAG: hypothetical protein ACR2KV_14200 [Solirubrobacteraceae bacterium]